MGRTKKSASNESNASMGDLFESCSSELQATDDKSAQFNNDNNAKNSFDANLGDLFANPPEVSEADVDVDSFDAAMQRQQAQLAEQQAQAKAKAEAKATDTAAKKPATKRKSKATAAVEQASTSCSEAVEAVDAEPKKGRKKKSTVMPPFDYPIDPVANVVCGIDEAGRGPLMGDVVAACVVLDHNHMIPGLNDSKKLTEKARDELAPLIKEHAIAWGIGRASPAEIDQYNILNATYIAMRRAYDAMCKRCNLALIDGNRVPKTFADLGVVCETVVKGDSKVPEISAASILAKTARDADMYELDKLHPEYGFAKHKGYPTADHMEILNHIPLLDCYRRSFGPIKRLLEERKDYPDL